jgi:hypothetical protein
MDTDKQPASKSEWTPREITPPVDTWVKKCSAFVEWCQSQLWGDNGKDTLEWLKSKRGLSESTIKLFRLGRNPKDLWRDRKEWGLPEELKENGKPKKLWIPAGVVIPHLAHNSIKRARIRRQDPEANPRYCIVSGSSTEAMILTNHRVFVVVESELDAILLHQEIGDVAGVISLGNAQSRPDKVTADLLSESDLILVALDGDDPGAKEAWQWWPQHFQQAKRLPPIDGKDPGEMWKAGVNLKMWVEIGIEKYLTPEPIIQSKESTYDIEVDHQGQEQPPEPIPHNPEPDPNGRVEPQEVKDIEHPPEGIESKIADLEQRILSTLQGKPLPIQITKAEKIIDLAKYARAESRGAYHQSQFVRNAARNRLELIGIKVEQ